MTDPQDQPSELKPTLEMDINRGGMTISEFMSKRDLAGGVTLEREADSLDRSPPGEHPEASGDSASSAPVDREGRKYAVGDLVAKGGMGAILSARDMNIRRNVAMKVMLDPKKAGEAQVLRFIEEAQVTGQLEHPSIVPVHELGVDAHDNVFYTMKLVGGATLKDILEGIRDGDTDTLRRFPLSQLLTIFQKACDAVAFAHTRGVVHRDLKPENIMVGDYGEVLVMDWGLAKIFGRDSGDRSDQSDRSDLTDRPESQVASVRSDRADDSLRTMDGQVLGTPAFMAPEQALGKIDAIDATTDIYALGAILYNVLALRPPIQGKSLNEVLLKVSKGTITAPIELDTSAGPPAASRAKRAARVADLAELQQRAAAARHAARDATRYPLPATSSAFPHCPGGRIPAALSAVAMKALALEQDARYQSVKELQSEIEAFGGGFATSAEQAGTARQLWLLIKRHKAVVSVAAAALVVLIAVVTGFVIKVMASERRAVAAKVQAEQSAEKARAARAEQAKLSKQAAPEFLAKARKLADRKEWSPALEAARIATGLDPDLREAWFLRGLLELGSRNFATAEDAFDNATKLIIPASKKHAKYTRYARWSRKCAQIAAKGGGKRDANVAFVLARALEQSGEYLVSTRLYKESGKKREGVLSFEMLAAVKGLARTNPGLEAEQISVRRADASGGRGASRLPPALRARSPRLGNGVGRGLPLPSPPHHGVAAGAAGAAAPSATRAAHPRGADEGGGACVVCHYGALVDVTPLAGTGVTALDLSMTRVRDIGPLAGLPLRSLNLAGTRVTDLTPLKGMPLAYLDLHKTNVSDISALAGLPLETLNLAQTKVTALAVAATLDGRGLVVPSRLPGRDGPGPASGKSGTRGGATGKEDPSGPPKGGTTNLGERRHSVSAPRSGLRVLDLTAIAVSDLSPLKGLPIEELYLDGTPVADLAPVSGLRLKVLSIADTRITDLTPLAGIPLESLHYTAANIAKGLDLIAKLPCAKAVPGRPWSIPDMGMQFVPMAPGSFVREDGATVTLTKPFWIGKYEVTQAEYSALMGENPGSHKGPRRPVETVNWHDAVAFCKKLTERERAAGRLADGYVYRLPTEAEWEYCCRAGTAGEYSFGDDPALLWKYGNYRDRSCGLQDGDKEYEKKDRDHDDGHNRTAPVGSYEANPWGLYDMHGNVWEWCWDWYGGYPSADATDPQGPGAGSRRLFRGGSWHYYPGSCRSAKRGTYAPDGRRDDRGFRLLRAIPCPCHP